ATKPPLRAGWRRGMLWRGRDVTHETVSRSCLVLAAHPDDETLGCGATILRKRTAGTKVWVVIATDGSGSHRSSHISAQELVSIRAQEAAEACALLDVPAEALIRFGYPDTRLRDHLPELVTRLRKLIAELQPDEILVTSHLDQNVDHQALARAVRLARDAAPEGCRIAEYPIWYWADGPWLHRSEDRPLAVRLADFWRDPLVSVARLRPELVAIDGLAGRKRDALLSYRSQTTNLTGEPGWATFDPSFIASFLDTHEVFFPLDDKPTYMGFSDRFLDDRPPGQVIGSTTSSGERRGGVDAERRIGIDHGALRIQPLVQPGWGRAGIAYGPFERLPGLTLTASVLNGHNASRSDPRREGRRARLRRWARELPQVRLRRPEHDDNLAVGWFPQPAPADPLAGGNGMIMHSASTLNGELRAHAAGRQMRIHRGVQNLPIQYVVALRERGAIYYAASVAGASGLTGHPHMRPAGIDHLSAEPVLHAGVHQCIVGEVGYRADTRVPEIRVGMVPELERWYATAQAADRLRGSGPLAQSAAETGEVWEASGTLLRSSDGLRGGEDGGTALLRPSAPCGLVHAVVQTGSDGGRAGLVWRADEAGACWRVQVDDRKAELAIHEEGTSSVVASSQDWKLRPNHLHALQILDDGATFGVHLDGELLFGRWLADPRGADARGVGITLGGATDIRVRDFEAHRRAVPIPPAIDLGPFWAERGTLPWIVEGFAGLPADLAGGRTQDGNREWRRVLGRGAIDRTGQGGARVRADRQHPNPGRTAYVVDWHDPTFADVEVEITPPGTARGQGENGRGGIVLWQDEDNYLIVNTWLDDLPRHDGSAISAFYIAQGKEDMYDAVWSNVGRMVTWGARYRLRVACDGERFLTWLNGEPVLYRALVDIRRDAPRLALRAVGLTANWEWGDDTGSVFHRFTARAKGADPGARA
ncbi:MAG: PIG-L family deacetylase, partial [Actinomycetota bacterium]|nr:PIG-L family deacetylase [Actinomycetota bacterium]